VRAEDIGNQQQGQPLAVAPVAAAYAANGFRIFPCDAHKRPIGALAPHGVLNATADPTIIRRWWRRAPFADIGWAIPNTIVAIDLDGPRGLADFAELASVSADDFPSLQATTPRAGRHVFCLSGGAAYRNAVRITGRSIDIRTIGGYVILPTPGSGRRWLPDKPRAYAPLPPGIAAALETRPAPMRCAGSAKADSAACENIAYDGPASRYGAAALRSILQAIECASNGRQEKELSWGARKIGILIAGRQLPDSAESAVIDAGLRMPSFDPRRPWRPGEIIRKVHQSIERGRAIGANP
jgi:hypothetical protein